MKTFKIEIDADNAAFGESNFDAAIEIGSILRALGNRLALGEIEANSAQWLRDTNGNRVGTYKFEVR